MSEELNFVLQQVPFSERPAELNAIKLPLILKNKSLMPPGTYNGYYINSDVIKKGFDASDWGLKEVRSLYVGHPSDPLTTEWVGEVQNQFIDEETGAIMGDVVIVDPATAIKLAYGAKFGISPSIEAVSDNRVVKKFTMRNFGLVIQPAMVRNYLNNALKQEVNMEGENQILEAISSLKSELVAMKQDIDSLKKVSFEPDVPEDEILEMAKGGFAEFFKEFKKKYPDATIQDAAKAYKKKVKEYPEPVEAKKEKYPEEDKKKVACAQEVPVEAPKPIEETPKTEVINNAEKKPSESEAIMNKLTELEAKLNKPVIETETATNTKTERIEDPNKVFFQWVKQITGD